ncbi:MAG TPA: type II toxin-antitoxin system RelE/ParE family toxin [Verrucomicrobiae bacterium]|nr:type II toxin-antitoxin system RelE/ParE family toxin [Verrucomicrobiae bacterium]
MAGHLISPRAIERLADLNATDSELEGIEAQVALLAKTPILGYLLPFSDPRELRRFDVGRFGLIYKFNDTRLEVVDVVV